MTSSIAVEINTQLAVNDHGNLAVQIWFGEEGPHIVEIAGETLGLIKDLKGRGEDVQPFLDLVPALRNLAAQIEAQTQ